MMISNQLKLFRPLLLIALMLGSTVPALAHRQPEVVATLEHAFEDGLPVSKVTWRLHAHDALAALELIPEAGRPDFDREETLIELAAYVASWVEYSGGEVTTLGAEVDGNFAYVYQLVSGHVKVEHAAALSDLGKNWSNLINLETVDGQRLSTTFTADYPGGTTAATR
ncbi:MAG: hypothetical protein AAGA69_00610 [Pseudomonadota bacterium]